MGGETYSYTGLRGTYEKDDIDNHAGIAIAAILMRQHHGIRRRQPARLDVFDGSEDRG